MKTDKWIEWAENPASAADEIGRLMAEVERLRGILRKCMPGADAIVDLGDGETMCLYQQSGSKE